jgi:hypothetical protein
MPNPVPIENGNPAERAAARKYGLTLKDSRTGFYDAVYTSNGRKVQIKAARHTRRDGPGVFRVWRHHLQRLDDSQGSVVLAVVNPDNDNRKVLKLKRVSPSMLLDVGEFRRTGQKAMNGAYEARIQWPDVISL